MKKTLITLLALSGLAMGATETLTLNLLPESTKDITTHPTYSEYSWYGWGNYDSDADVVNNIKFNLEKAPKSLAIDGWSAMNEAANAALSSDKIEIEEVTVGEVTKDVLTVAGNTILMYQMDVSELTSSATTGTVTGVTSLTFNFDFYSGGKSSFAVASINEKANKVTAIHHYTGNELTTGTKTIEHDNLTLTADDRLVLILRVNNGTDKLAGFSMTADVVTTPTVTPGDNVPEPTTATLSLLALAGLAARRRRR